MSTDTRSLYYFGLLIGIALLIYSGVMGFRSLRFTLEGVETRATVTDSYEVYSRGSSSRCAYQFLVAGKVYEGTADNCQLTKNQPINVRYLKSNPSENESRSKSRKIYQWIVLAVSLILILFCSIMIRIKASSFGD